MQCRIYGRSGNGRFIIDALGTHPNAVKSGGMLRKMHNKTKKRGCFVSFCLHFPLSLIIKLCLTSGEGSYHLDTAIVLDRTEVC